MVCVLFACFVLPHPLELFFYCSSLVPSCVEAFLIRVFLISFFFLLHQTSLSMKNTGFNICLVCFCQSAPWLQFNLPLVSFLLLCFDLSLESAVKHNKNNHLSFDLFLPLGMLLGFLVHEKVALLFSNYCFHRYNQVKKWYFMGRWWPDTRGRLKCC